MRNYTDFSEFENVFLEDSFVLRIKTTASLAEFLVETVLTKNHLLYEKPKKNEQYCYKKGIINFPNVKQIIWIEITIFPSVDINLEVDFGNIDSFFYENDFYSMSGEWGRVKIKSQNPTIKFIE